MENDKNHKINLLSCLSKRLLYLRRYCRGPNAAPASGQVEVPNSQLISCLDSSLGRASACGAGGHVCLGALLEDRDDPGLSIVRMFFDLLPT